MTEIVFEMLWVGVVHESRDLRRLYELGVEAVVDLAASEAPASLGRDIAYCRLPISDGVGNPREMLRLAVLCVEQFVRAGRPTLVVCGAGLSRSPCVVAGALSRWRGITMEAALRDVAGRHHCNISPGFWQELIASLATVDP